MILRSVAVLLFVAGTVVLLSGLTLLGRAPGLPEETRHLRAMKDRREPPAQVRDVSMNDIAALPHGVPMATRSALENQGVRMEGWVQRMVMSGDGDLHLELVEHRRHLGERDTGYVVAEISPLWRQDARSWSYESLLQAFRPNHGGPSPWQAGPRHVRLTGWLNYDLPYDRAPSTWLLENGAARRTGWEIHPVTRIEMWDEQALAWQELRR